MKREDGSWELKNDTTTKVITDENNNGIPDAGDTYSKRYDRKNGFSINRGEFLSNESVNAFLK